MITHGLEDATKGRLRQVVQRLRERLLVDIAAEADRRYRFSIHTDRAGLRAGVRSDREALEQIVARREASGVSRERVLGEMVAEAASTLLHRLVLIRHMETTGILPMKLLTGGVQSVAYREASEFLPELVGRPDDASKGFGHLLSLLYDELSTDLPGLFGDVGTTRLFPVAPATLLTVIEDLDDGDLGAAWEDDTTTGWVYQFWNDAEKKRIDDKIGDGTGEGTGKGKVEAHEIAPKTALYTERYMVEWLLQNSVGAMWRAICRKQRWPCEADEALPRLEAMRAAGRVDIEDDAIDRWKYHVDVPLSAEFVDAAPESIRNLRLLDPACGSGHFLVAAFDWLFAAWRAEATATGKDWSDADIAAGIVENNLHGIDIDPPAVQLAAAAVYLKARQHGAHPERLNLVASHFGLRWVTAEDRRAFAERVAEATAVDPRVVETLLVGLTRADTLGSLLKVEDIDRELLPLLSTVPMPRTARREGSDAGLFRQADVRERMAALVAQRMGGLTRTDDLGVRLGGEQLAAGLRFTGMLKAGSYDVVVANPPYLGIRKVDQRIADWFTDGDLYACFLRRGRELARQAGLCAMITMHGWMFLEQMGDVRRLLLAETKVSVLAHLGRGGGFSGWSDFDKVMQTVMVVLSPSEPPGVIACFRLDHLTNAAKREALRDQRPGFWSPQTALTTLPGSRVLYWWSSEMIERYRLAQKLGDIAPVRQGMATSDNGRFLLNPWEIDRDDLALVTFDQPKQAAMNSRWVPYVKGAGAKVWIEPADDVLRWGAAGLQLRVFNEFQWGSYTRTIKNEQWYFFPGVTFTYTGTQFSARAFRYRSCIDVQGSSVFSEKRAEFTCMLNSPWASEVLQSLNPGVNFQVGDVNGLPVFEVDGAGQVFAVLEDAFSAKEAHRETSVEFRSPGPSPWKHAQHWARSAVERAPGLPVPAYVPREEDPVPSDFLSHALGITLGRFPGEPLPTRILFLAARGPDNLASAPLLTAAWESHGFTGDLRDYLREGFFKHDHLSRYENRPIHWPLSSENCNFVAWVCVHSFTDGTLDRLRSEHIKPCLDALERLLADAPTSPPAKGKKGKDPVQELRELVAELVEFDRTVERIARHGPDRDRQESGAPYRMELEDGVRVSSACLYPLLAPQWAQPEKWWKEIASAAGKTAADWSKSAARYWPNRVDRKCREEPSHAVAHGCFWLYHPVRAWNWELRLQDEIGARPDGSPFRIDEARSDDSRATFLIEQPGDAVAGLVKEAARRAGKRRKAGEAPAPSEMEFYESGLWTREPVRMWNAELELIKRTKDDVRLVAPDEAPARAKLLAANPGLVKEREKVLRKARKESEQLGLGFGGRETEDADV